MFKTPEVIYSWFFQISGNSIGYDNGGGDNDGNGDGEYSDAILIRLRKRR